MRLFEFLTRLGVKPHTLFSWLQTYGDYLPGEAAPEGGRRDYSEELLQALKAIKALKDERFTPAKIRGILAERERSKLGAETYTLCESKNCAARSMPGRRFCSVHRSLEGRAVTVCREPADPATRRAMLATVEAVIEELPRPAAPSWTPGPAFGTKRAVVGYWCSRCRQVLQLHFKSCSCLADVEDAKVYAAFRAQNWKDCFVEVSHA